MNPLFQKFLAVHGIEYLFLDRDLKIITLSDNVQRFAETPDRVMPGDDIGLAFPELIGVEELLIDVLEGRQLSFQLKSLGRFLEFHPPVYFDIYIIQTEGGQTPPNSLIVFLEDVTDRMSLEQRLVQATNETHLSIRALSNSKHYIEKLMDSIVEVSIVTDRMGGIKKVNHTTLNLFEYSETELIGQPISLLVPQDEVWLQTLCYVRADRKEREVNWAEVQCLTKTGKKLYMAFSCTAMQADLEAEKLDFVYIGRDITDLKRQERGSRVQSATLQIISESATIPQAAAQLLPALCEILDWDRGEIWLAQQTLHWTGEAAGERWEAVNFLRCIECWQNETIAIPDSIAETQDKTLAMGEGLPGRVWAEGSPLWIGNLSEASSVFPPETTDRDRWQGALAVPICEGGNPPRDPEQPPPTQAIAKVLGVMMFYRVEVDPPDRDLIQTLSAIACQLGQFIQRKQIESALEESERCDRALWDNATDPIHSVTPDGRFLYVNRAWRETLGYSATELMQLTLFDIIAPESQPRVFNAFSTAISGEAIATFTLDAIAKNGQAIALQGTLNCKFINGKAIAIQAIFPKLLNPFNSD